MLSTVRVPFPISSDTSALGPRAGIDPTSDSASGIGGAWRALHRPGDGGIPTSRPTGPPAAGRGPRAGGPERARRRLICLQTCLQSPRALPGEPGRALCLPRGAARIRTGDKGFAVLCLTTWPRPILAKLRVKTSSACHGATQVAFLTAPLRGGWSCRAGQRAIASSQPADRTRPACVRRARTSDTRTAGGNADRRPRRVPR